MKKYNVLILGAGSAGLTALAKLRHHYKKVGIINAGAYGTTCARVGCMPSKILIQIAEDYHRALQLYRKGLLPSEPKDLNASEVMKYMRSWRDKFVAGTNRPLADLGENKIDGRAVFVDLQTVKVGDELYQADYIVVAVGSAPVVPAPWKALGDKVMTSDEVFEMEDIPKSMGVVGLGVIGLELGQAFHRLGSQVVGLDLATSIGGITDPDVLRVAREMIGSEFPMHLGVQVDLVDHEDGVLIKTADKEFIVEKVLLSMGRRSHVPALGLQELGIECDERGVPLIDPQTLHIPGTQIYIVGDANGIRPILHEAADEGRMVSESIIRQEVLPFKRKCPMGVCFSSPQIISVGARWSELEGREDIVVSDDQFTMGRSKVIGESGMMKIYADKKGFLLGAEMIGPQVEHLAHYLSLAIEKQISVTELLQSPIYHPTVEESLRSALRKISRELSSHLGEEISQEVCCLKGGN